MNNDKSVTASVRVPWDAIIRAVEEITDVCTEFTEKDYRMLKAAAFRVRCHLDRAKWEARQRWQENSNDVTVNIEPPLTEKQEIEAVVTRDEVKLQKKPAMQVIQKRLSQMRAERDKRKLSAKHDKPKLSAKRNKKFSVLEEKVWLDLSKCLTSPMSGPLKRKPDVKARVLASIQAGVAARQVLFELGLAQAEWSYSDCVDLDLALKRLRKELNKA